MRVGFVGCGKLGLMVALSIESRGHEVCGYDIDSRVAGYLAKKEIPYKEEGATAMLLTSNMRMLPLDQLCDWADILFLAPQTPHDHQYEGITRLPETREDFNYHYLRACVSDVCAVLKEPKTCVIISTVLPGTIEREVLPLLTSKFRLVYEPLFIAMGTVRRDFLNPEFVLAGAFENQPLQELERFYKTIHDKPVFKTDVRTAEGIKVFYNTFITAKTVLANLYGEMAARTGMNVDDIFRAVSLATDRLISPKYLKAGMGDGGGCHPRDNIALSWLARETGASYDFFESLMIAREKHCEFLADVIEQYRDGLPVQILGRSFKPETNIETGSPAVLLSAILRERGIAHECTDDYVPKFAFCYFIGTKHEAFTRYEFPQGSIVIDPFRYLKPQAGVKLISIGDGTKLELSSSGEAVRSAHLHSQKMNEKLHAH